MEKVSVTDKDGAVLGLVRVEGRLLPPCMKSMEEYEAMHTLQARDDDVIVCGYPKTGTHWTTEVVSMLLRGSAEFMKIPKSKLMLERTIFIGTDMSHYDEMESPRVLNSHLSYAMLPSDFIKKKSKILYVCRNPKDCFVSYYNFLKGPLYEGSWDAFFALSIEGQVPYDCIFDDLARWQTDMDAHPDAPILVVYYEDLKQDFMKQARRLCAFLGVSRDDEFLASVNKECSFNKMKERDEQSAAPAPKGPVKIYRKGDVGDWRNWFTVAQNERFDELSRTKSEGLKYDFKYVL